MSETPIGLFTLSAEIVDALASQSYKKIPSLSSDGTRQYLAVETEGMNGSMSHTRVSAATALITHMYFRNYKGLVTDGFKLPVTFGVGKKPDRSFLFVKKIQEFPLDAEKLKDELKRTRALFGEILPMSTVMLLPLDKIAFGPFTVPQAHSFRNALTSMAAYGGRTEPVDCTLHMTMAREAYMLLDRDDYRRIAAFETDLPPVMVFDRRQFGQYDHQLG